MGNGEAKLSPRGEEQGPAQGEVGGQARWGLGPALGGTQDVLLHRKNRHSASPLPPSLGADRGWHIPGTHTYMNTHTHAHTLPYQPDNLVLKSGSSSESQPSPPVLGLDNRMARETLQFFVRPPGTWWWAGVLSTAPQPGQDGQWPGPWTRASRGALASVLPAVPRPPWLHPS